MPEPDLAADPFGLRLARDYRADILQRPRVVGPQARNPDDRNSSAARAIKRNLGDLAAHWQTCDLVPSQCRDGRGYFGVAENVEEGNRMADILLVEATKYYQVVAFDLFFNQGSRDRTKENLVLVVGTLSGKAAAFRVDRFPDHRLPAGLVNLFNAQFCLVSDNVVHKFQFLMRTQDAPRCWLDTGSVSSRLPGHPRWRWAVLGKATVEDLCETVFGVYPGSLEYARAKARPITASLGEWPAFKTPGILEVWGPGPLEVWRAAHFRNGVCKHFGLLVLFTLLEFEAGKFSEEEEYTEPLLTVVSAFCRKSSPTTTPEPLTSTSEEESRPVAEATMRPSAPPGSVSSAESRKRDDVNQAGKLHPKEDRSSRSYKRSEKRKRSVDRNSGSPSSPRPSRRRRRHRSRSGERRRRSSTRTDRRRRYRSRSRTSSPSGTRAGSRKRSQEGRRLNEDLQAKLDALTSAVQRLDSRREFENTVHQSLQRTLEMASSARGSSDSASVVSGTSDSGVPQSPAKAGTRTAAKLTQIKNVHDRLGPRVEPARDRLGPRVKPGPEQPTVVQLASRRRLHPKDQAPKDLGKSRWFETPCIAPLKVTLPLTEREAKLSLELLRAHPSSYFPLRWQSHPMFYWACKFCGENKKHRAFANCSACVKAWREEQRENDMNRWKKSHCVYPLCTQSRDHVIGACPTLHRLCLTCGKRGHAPSDCTRPDLERVFQIYGPRGAYTRASFNRGTTAKAAEPVWGWSPLDSSPNMNIQLLVGKFKAQWNYWGKGWTGIQESSGETLDGLIRREHAKTRGPGELDSSEGGAWGAGLAMDCASVSGVSPVGTTSTDQAPDDHKTRPQSLVVIPKNSALHREIADCSLNSSELEKI